jgi:hypothetical protein
MMAIPSAILKQARALIRAQADEDQQHRFLCHSDGSPCPDGCDVGADPVRAEALEVAICGQPSRRRQRTDPHRPGAIIPADYEPVLFYACARQFVPSYGVDCVREAQQARAMMRYESHGVLDAQLDAMPEPTHAEGKLCCIAALRESGERFADTGGTGHCTICGAGFIEGEVWKHTPTGILVHLGHQCARKYELLADRSEWELARARRAAALATAITRAQNAERRNAFLAAHPELPDLLAVDHYITRDIARKFTTDHSRDLSDAQLALLAKLKVDVAEAATRKAAQDAERHVPAPTGRVTFTGEIVSAKTVESDFGEVTKLVVKMTTDDGATWIAYLNEQSAAHDGWPLRGRTITLAATLTPGRDAHFAFGKRPTLKALVPTAETLEAAKVAEEEAHGSEARRQALAEMEAGFPDRSDPLVAAAAGAFYAARVRALGGSI